MLWQSVIGITLPIVIVTLGTAWVGYRRTKRQNEEARTTAALKDLDRRVTAIEERLAPTVRG